MTFLRVGVTKITHEFDENTPRSGEDGEQNITKFQFRNFETWGGGTLLLKCLI